MRLIAGYVRVSTQKQAEEGVSVEMQKAQIINHLKLVDLIHDENEVDFYIDEGQSGSSLHRPAMTQLLKVIKKGEVELLVTYDLSRISRDIFDSNTFLNLVEKNGVILKCLHDDVSIATAGNRFSTYVKIAVNQFEREKIVERTNDGLLSIVESGRYPCGGKPMFGYYRGEDKHLYIDEENSAIVKEMFAYAIEGYELSVIARLLNEKYDKYNFNLNQIYNILRNKRYTGTLVYKGKEYKDLYPALITEEEMRLAQANTRRRAVWKSENYVLDELLFCKHCGRRLICMNGNSMGKKYFYYKCTVCKKQISQVTVLDHLDNTELNTERLNVLKERYTKRRASLYRRIQSIDKEYIQELYTQEEYLLLRKPLEVKLLEIEREIEMMSLDSLRMKLEKKKEYYRLHIYKVIVDLNTKKVVEIKLKEPK